MLRKIVSTFGKILFILMLILLISWFGPNFIYYFERGIYRGYSISLEYKISKVINNIKQTKNITPIFLQDFSDRKIVKACAQWPYASQSIFEERIGAKLSDFNETSDHDGYVLWLFFSDGSISRARIPIEMWYELPEIKSYKEQQCTQENLKIFFKLGDKTSPNIISFYFK